MISAIWAMDKNWLVGDGDKIPWRIKEDLKYFREMSEGKTVLMGDKTYYSLKGYYNGKELPYGKIYVASLDKNLNLDDAIVIDDLTGFLETTEEDIMVVGGPTIYELALPYVDVIYITHIDAEFKGDTYMKKTDEFNDFRKLEYTLLKSESGPCLEFATYRRLSYIGIDKED